jgi:hypothetical protein
VGPFIRVLCCKVKMRTNCKSKTGISWRMPSSGMLRRVALIRTEVSDEHRFLQEPHGVTSQKTAFFRVIAVKNLKSYWHIVFSHGEILRSKCISNLNIDWIRSDIVNHNSGSNMRLGDLIVNGWIILNLFLKKCDKKIWIRLIWLRIGTHTFGGILPAQRMWNSQERIIFWNSLRSIIHSLKRV